MNNLVIVEVDEYGEYISIPKVTPGEPIRVWIVDWKNIIDNLGIRCPSCDDANFEIEGNEPGRFLCMDCGTEFDADDVEPVYKSGVEEGPS